MVSVFIEGTPATFIENPARIITAAAPADVPAALADLQAALADGFTAAGFFAYELGYLMDPATEALLPPDRAVPLLWFALTKTPTQAAPHAHGTYSLGAITPGWDRDAYKTRCTRVIDHLRAGDLYQANLTFRARFDMSGDPYALYTHLRTRQPATYGGYIDAGEFQILSLSPELFIDVEGSTITTRPMKGTAPLSVSPDALKADEKSRAENLMIVDLMRNDLGRIGRDVRTSNMFHVDTYPTLHQMISTIQASLKDNKNLQDLLRALFPPGSVTGAPKIAAMKLIHELEDTPRGAYCGAIGVLYPNGDMRLNVGIRTITIQNGTGEIGIGSGIVVESDPDSEYDECLLKMSFITAPAPDYGLIESLRYIDGEYYLYDQHLARLRASAKSLGFAFDEDKIRAAFADVTGDGTQMVRMVLSANGDVSVTAKPLTLNPDGEMRFVISDKTVSTADKLLYHKTTRREFYDGEHARMTANGSCDEVVFLNERGELAEGSRTNIFLDKGDGVLLTPPLSSGLLPGTLRTHLLDTGRARESVLKLADLAENRVFLGNSVRGLLRGLRVG